MIQSIVLHSRSDAAAGNVLVRAAAPAEIRDGLDPACVLTSEEGEVTARAEFLDALRPLPAGLSGGITVKELTVQEFPSFAVVRYLADEWESVFGQRLVTRYRVTDTFRRDGDSWKMVASHVAVVI